MKAVREFFVEYRGFLLFVALLFVFRSSFADWNRVPTGSMIPTIQIGDHILVDKMAYDLRVPFTHISLKKMADPERGDIVVFDSAVLNKRMVKRVVAVPGDVIEMDGNRLILNGEPQPYVINRNLPAELEWKENLAGVEHLIHTRHYPSPYASFDAVMVPDDFYYVMGDNRDNSHDSRAIGLVPRNEIVGRTESVILSLDYDNWYLPRSDRFWQPLDRIEY